MAPIIIPPRKVSFVFLTLLIGSATPLYARWWQSSESTPSESSPSAQDLLFNACANGYLQTVRELVDRSDIAIDSRDSNQRTPLFHAILNGHAEIASLLLHHGADVNTKDHIGDTPLKWAAYNGNSNLVRILLNYKADMDIQDTQSGRTALLDALYQGHYDIALLLIEQGASPNATDFQGATALILSTIANQPRLVEKLLEKGANVNATTATGHSAITCTQSPVIIALLKKYGAKLSISTPQGMRDYVKDLLGISEELRELLLEKIKQFENAQDNPHERESLRQNLEYAFKIPWGIYSTAEVSLDNAQQILDTEHEYLSKAKEEILDYIALHQSAGNAHAPILCLAGPPGVGKTTLAQSIAKSLGRSFERVGLGGISDPYAIRGHQRVYIGAEPGYFTKALIHAQTANPVILVDEVDKMGTRGWHGDPYAALLELFDPAQNHAFRDENLGLPIDFSQVVFIVTANDLHNIPRPLYDRMKIIELSSYTDDEKVTIIQNHLVARVAKECGLNPQDLALSPELIKYLIDNYTREAGVRSMARILKTLCAKIARAKLAGKPLVLTQEILEKYLGPAPFHNKQWMLTPTLGSAHGLYWSSIGGGVLDVETALLKQGKGSLILTGSLGDVMQESAKIAVNYIWSHAEALGIDPTTFTTHNIHIHFPEGATPKDGPSAGTALVTSLVSRLTGKPVRGDIAMTGEINLRGEVTAIGGLKEKVLGAKRAGVVEVIAPWENRYDLIDEPKITAGITFHWVKTIDEVIAVALV